MQIKAQKIWEISEKSPNEAVDAAGEGADEALDFKGHEVGRDV